MTTSNDLGKILGRVRALINRADHENTPEHEAAACREKAEQLMRQYRLDEENLMASDVDAVIEPIEMRIDVGIDSSSSYLGLIWTMLNDITRHAGCRVASKWEREPDSRKFNLVAKVVGYEGDARFVDLLYTSARLVWSRRVDPKINPKLTDAENIYWLRSSGLSRAQVANMVWGSGMKDGPAHGRVQRIYAQMCELRGEQPAIAGRSMSAKTYRQAFAEQFVITLRNRLQAARESADKADRPMELHGRKERVDEKFYELNPNLRPQPQKEGELEPEKPKKSRRKGWTKAHEAQYQRMHHSPAALAARSAGRAAADEVSLTGTDRVKRIGTDASVVDGEVIEGNELEA